MSERRRNRGPRRTARRGLPVQGAVPPRRPVAPVARRWGTFIALALVVLALIAGFAARQVVATGVFRVQGVQVLDASPLTDANVRAAAAAVEGRQIWQVRAPAVAAAVEGVPGVKAAHVQRSLPNRVRVAVEERVPAAIWRAAGADLVVDDDGVVLDAPVMGGLPAIHYLDGVSGLGVGSRVDGDAVRLAGYLAAAIPAAAGQRVARFEYSGTGGLDVVTDRGLRVRFGGGHDVEYKLELWRTIADQAAKDKIPYTEIDLRFGRWVALR
jgi:cell division septal protein FtsQ